MNVGEVAAKIEERLPLAWSEEWDNSGLLIGDPDAPVERIAVSLDATEETVRDAKEHGCGMLVVHHPAIFLPMKRIVSPSPVAKMIRAAIIGGVAVYSAHTNWDSSPEGINVILSRQLGLLDVSPLMPSHNGAWGMGAIGNLASPMTVSGLAKRTKELWGLSAILTYGDESDALSRVALCGGAGGDFLQTAINMGADVFITADVSHHYLLQAQSARTHLIAVNHGEMECVSLPDFRALVMEAASLDVVLLENGNWTPLVI
jgi:dinuclear metal center YbgI/SA1388 family protein